MPDLGSLPPPPPVPQRQPLILGHPLVPRLRRVTTVAAVAAVAAASVTWLLSFLPGSPTAGLWPALMIPAVPA